MAKLDTSWLRDLGNPHWVDVLPAGEFLGLADKTILHSGPPIEFARMCRGHRRSMVNACFFEGWAKTEAAALADDESVLVPLALKLIGEVGCGMPESLFLAMHTVSEHIKEMNHG